MTWMGGIGAPVEPADERLEGRGSSADSSEAPNKGDRR